MSVRKKYIKHRTDRRLRRVNNFLLLLIALMIAMVVYDAIVYKTPLYYIGFMLAGYLIGGLFKRTLVVEFKVSSDSFELSTNVVYIVLTVLFIVIRWALAKTILEKLEVVYISNAIYLFFMGLYYSKWRLVMKKIDEVVYEFAEKKHMERKEDIQESQSGE